MYYVGLGKEWIIHLCFSLSQDWFFLPVHTLLDKRKSFLWTKNPFALFWKWEEGGWKWPFGPRTLREAKLSPKLCIRHLILVFAIYYAFHLWFLDFFGELWFVCCWYFLFDERKRKTWSLTRITPLFSHCDLIVADNLMVNEMRSLTRVTPFSHTLSPLQLILLKRTILGKEFFPFLNLIIKLPSCPCKAPHQKNEILNKSLGMSEKVSHEWVNIFYNLKTKSGLDIDSASDHHFQTWAEMCPNWGWNLNITIWW